MIPLKSVKEIRIMQQGGKKLAWVMEKILDQIKPGMRLKELDRLAETLIKKQEGKPSFKMVEGYHWASCLNVNQGVVHGVPTDYRLKVGDVISVDIGMFYKGLHTDMARTVLVGPKVQSMGLLKKFLDAGEAALEKAITAATPGNRVGHISQAIQKVIEKNGYQPIQALTGHGVGKELHEPPAIPCFLKGKVEITEKLKPGMTLAIEVIYAQGRPEVVVKEDDWTVETADGKVAGLFEDTVAITKQGPLTLTQV